MGGIPPASAQPAAPLPAQPTSSPSKSAPTTSGVLSSESSRQTSQLPAVPKEDQAQSLVNYYHATRLAFEGTGFNAAVLSEPARLLAEAAARANTREKRDQLNAAPSDKTEKANDRLVQAHNLEWQATGDLQAHADFICDRAEEKYSSALATLKFLDQAKMPFDSLPVVATNIDLLETVHDNAPCFVAIPVPGGSNQEQETNEADVHLRL
jgi:hypothetical protein